MEIWQPIEGYENYLISNTGKVYSKYKNKQLAIHPIKNGYLVADLYANGKRKTAYVHRLVAEAFCVHPYGNNVVNHIDSNRKNNNSTNLEWVPDKGNIHHAITHHRFDNGRKSQANKIKRPIIGTNIKTGETKRYTCINDAEKDGFKNSCISHCLNGDYKTTRGWTWEYEIKEGDHTYGRNETRSSN